MLEEYGKAKVNRIDIFMEKFKGKENLLLEKMMQRYEGSVSVSTEKISYCSRLTKGMNAEAKRVAFD